jgi:hypothetical protein
LSGSFGHALAIYSILRELACPPNPVPGVAQRS